MDKVSDLSGGNPVTTLGPEAAAEVSVLPGQLSARIFRHDVATAHGPVPCWTFVTAGLVRHRQEEVIVSLRRRRWEAAADYPRPVLELLGAVYRQARDERVAVAGGVAEFPIDVLGHGAPTGVVFGAAPRPVGGNGLEGALAGLLLRPEEIEAARQVGVARVTALLAQAVGDFPWPSWSDRDRPSVLCPADVRASVLADATCLLGTGTVVRAYRTTPEACPPAPHGLGAAAPSPPLGQQIELRVPAGSRARLAEALGQLPPRIPLALLTTPDPYADTRLAWRPGQGPAFVRARASDGLHVTGNFVLFAHAPEARDGAALREDGFALDLHDASWARLLRAVQDGESLDLPGSEGQMGLSLDWVASRPGPAGKAARGSSGRAPVVAIQGLFYQPHAVLRQRVDADEFIDFLVAVDQAVHRHFASVATDSGQDLTLVVAIRPGRQARYWLDLAPGEPRKGIVEGLINCLRGLRPPSVRRGPICHGTQWRLWGGARRGGGFRLMPSEWEAATAVARGELRIPDDVLRVIWPG